MTRKAKSSTKKTKGVSPPALHWLSSMTASPANKADAAPSRSRDAKSPRIEQALLEEVKGFLDLIVRSKEVSFDSRGQALDLRMRLGIVGTPGRRSALSIRELFDLLEFMDCELDNGCKDVRTAAKRMKDPPYNITSPDWRQLENLYKSYPREKREMTDIEGKNTG